MFLSADQLHELTGYKKPALQRRWLADNGFSFEVRSDGRPVVSRNYYEERQFGPKRDNRLSGPNLDGLD